MNIKNIQIAQGLFRTAGDRLNAKKDAESSSRDVSLPKVPVDDVKKVDEGENILEVVYPPFFPIGSTQRILEIDGVKLLAEKNVKSESPPTLEEQKAKKQEEIRGTGPPQAGAEPPRVPQVKHEVKPGSVLDLKI